jgi:hypothetical protein
MMRGPTDTAGEMELLGAGAGGGAADTAGAGVGGGAGAAITADGREMAGAFAVPTSGASTLICARFADDGVLEATAVGSSFFGVCLTGAGAGGRTSL